MSVLKWIEEWYFDQCDGDWEHMQGIEIKTLDNPGWRVNISHLWPLLTLPKSDSQCGKSEFKLSHYTQQK